jgi:hypothetical protein
MGAWGILAFDNDTACDWAEDLGQVSDLSLVEQALGEVEKVGDALLERDTAWNALAACEVIARLQGNVGYMSGHTSAVDIWVFNNNVVPTAALVARASAVIDRILSDDSELRDLWCADDQENWLAMVEELRSRMQVRRKPGKRK